MFFLIALILSLSELLLDPANLVSSVSFFRISFFNATFTLEGNVKEFSLFLFFVIFMI